MQFNSCYDVYKIFDKLNLNDQNRNFKNKNTVQDINKFLANLNFKLDSK